MGRDNNSGHRNRGLLHLWLQCNRISRLPLADPSANRQPGSGLDGVGLSHFAPSLTSLDVSGNRLEGPFPSPSQFPANLAHLDLSNNRISAVGARGCNFVDEAKSNEK